MFAHVNVYVHLYLLYNKQRENCVRSFQGYNTRKVISEVYASFVLQCTVSGRLCKHKTDISQPDTGSIFHIKNQ